MGEQDNIKCFHTKGGTTVEFVDTQDGELISIQTPKGLSIEMADGGETIRFSCGNAQSIIVKDGQVRVTGQKELMENAGAQLSIDPTGKIILQGNNIEIRGTAVTLDSTSSLEMKSTQFKLSSAIAEIKADGMLTLKAVSPKLIDFLLIVGLRLSSSTIYIVA